MPLSAGHASRRRDQRLARTRRISLWLAGGAAAASLGLGTAFARDLPGHHAPGAGTQPAGAAGTQPQPARPPTTQPGTAPSSGPTHLAQPAQPPATTPAAPQATSGGS